MARSYLKVYFDFEERTDELNDGEKGRLLLALLRYAVTGVKPTLTGNERFAFSILKGEIDRDIASYDAKVANGRLGGRPSKEQKTKENQTKPKITKAKPNETENNLNAKNKEEDIKETLLTESKEKRTRFSPPSVEEVAAYCKERGNRINPQTFVDFYSAKGWRVGQNPMKDWKACVRTWEQRDSTQPVQKPKLLRAQDYDQREYNEAEMKKVLGVDDLFISDEEYMKRYGRPRPA